METRIDVLFADESRERSLRIFAGGGVKFQDGETVLFTVGARTLIKAICQAVVDADPGHCDWAQDIITRWMRGE